MSEEKKKVGRPKKYESRAERQKAYLERKKQKMKDLEEQVKKLESQDMFSSDINLEAFEDIKFKKVPKYTWRKITPSEIAVMGTKDLEVLIEEFRERIQQYSSFSVALENITLGIISKNHLISKEDTPPAKIQEANHQINENIKNLDERMQQQTLLFLLEAELVNRYRLEGRETKLDLFEASIDELEKDVKKELEKEAQ
ncbi:MAG: hypothetical protein ACTSPK_03915 [Candidatus Heimdallarchaeota archaeon]